VAIEIMAPVLYRNIPTTRKMILLIYANFANDEGSNIFPSVGKVALMAGMSERTIQNETKAMKKEEILINEGHGPKGTNRYKINMGKIYELYSEINKGGETTSPVNLTTQRGESDDTKGCKAIAPDPLKSVKDTSINKHNYYPIAEALSKVTKMDLNINKPRIFKAAKTLSQGSDVTPERILKDYGSGGIWYSKDWRGLKGQVPTLQQIIETWGTFDKSSELFIRQNADGSFN
jgi:hypothetical protein